MGVSGCWWPPILHRATRYVEEVAHAINYDMPKLAEDFIHCVGRTGRAAAQGRASTLVAGAQVLELGKI